MGFNFDLLLQDCRDMVTGQVKDVCTGIAVFLVSILMLKIFRTVVLHRLKIISRSTKNDFDDLLIDIVDSIGWPFYVVLSCFVSLQFVAVHGLIRTLVGYAVLVCATFYVVRGIQHFIDYSLGKIVKRRQKDDKEVNTQIIHLMSGILKVSMWVIATVLILSNLGYDVTGLVAGLGIGGLAIAFALQNVLSDIFASFSIFLDRPFEPGDFIIVGEDMGVVERIGIKTTRLTSLWGQEIVISNQELTSSRINNYKKMSKRRIHFSIGVTYDTPVRKLERIPGIVKEIFDMFKDAELNRVHFKSFGDFSLNFEIAYYVDTGDYNKYMDIQQDINFEIKRRFDRENIEFAFPSQTIYLHKR